MADQDANTLGYRQMLETDPMSDRSENNPLKALGFWTSPWSIKVKILRQLVDWNRELHLVPGNCRSDLIDTLPAVSDSDVHDIITTTRAKGKGPSVYDVERWDKGQEQQHWQTVESENAAFRLVYLFRIR